MERALPKNILVAGLFLTCLTFIFFSDMFTPLSTILQFAIQATGAEEMLSVGCRASGKHGGPMSVCAAGVLRRQNSVYGDGRDRAVSDGACAVTGIPERDGGPCEARFGPGAC